MSVTEKIEGLIGKLFIGLIAILSSLSGANAQETPLIARASIEELQNDPSKFTDAADLSSFKNFLNSKGISTDFENVDLISSVNEETLNVYRQSVEANAAIEPGPNCVC